MPEPPADDRVEFASEEIDHALIQRRGVDDHRDNEPEKGEDGAAAELPTRAFRVRLDHEPAEAKTAIGRSANTFVSLRRAAGQAPKTHQPPETRLLGQRKDVDRVAA